LHCQNAGGRWNINIGNIAGLAWGWTVLLIILLPYSTSQFQFSISTGRTIFKYPHFGNADR
jgi:hypothetical protein